MDQHFLPRPKFTTRRRTALFVRVVSTVSSEQTAYRVQPIQLLKDALSADVDSENSPAGLLAVWEQLKAHAYPHVHAHDEEAEGTTPPMRTVTLSALLTEEVIGLLTSTSGEFADHLPSTSPPVAPSQTSLAHRQPESVSGHGHGTTSGTSRAPSDWDGFTSAGFGFMDGGLNLAGGLQDYISPPTSPGKTKRRSLELGRRTSVDKEKDKNKVSKASPPPAPMSPPATSAGMGDPKPSIVTETVASTLLLDEALIDGWADTLSDPVVASAWPTFVLYHLKTPLVDPTAAAAQSKTTATTTAAVADEIGWLVIETYVPPQPRKDHAAGAAGGGKEKEKGGREKTKERRSSSRPRFGAFFSNPNLGGAYKDKDKEKAKDKDKDKEGKKKDKEAVRRRSSVGASKGMFSSFRNGV
jgi:hypothetical protein